MSTVFLSYAAADRARVEPLVKALEAHGFDVWWDRDISLGESYHRVIQQALERAVCAVVVWSHHSIGSEWVTNEASEARKRGILVPALLDDVEPPLEFRHLQSATLFAWQGAMDDSSLQQLISAVRRVAERGGAPSVVSGRATAEREGAEELVGNACRLGGQCRRAAAGGHVARAGSQGNRVARGRNATTGCGNHRAKPCVGTSRRRRFPNHSGRFSSHSWRRPPGERARRNHRPARRK